MLQETSLEFGGPISAYSSLPPLTQGVFVVNWFRHYAFGTHAGGWLALGMVILLALVSGIAVLKLVLWPLTPERDKDESDYWRIHGG